MLSGVARHGWLAWCCAGAVLLLGCCCAAAAAALLVHDVRMIYGCLSVVSNLILYRVGHESVDREQQS